jgi:hypothetical protein
MRLLQVVAEELVQLDELGSVLLQPAGVALVQVSPHRLRKRVVGSVADQQVAEAETVVADDLRPVGPDQLLADERSQAGSHVSFLGCECLDGSTVEDFALDRAPLEHSPLRCIELVEACREQGLQAGRDDDFAAHFACHCEHLLDEERIAAGGVSDLHTQLVGDPLGDQLVDIVVAQWLESKSHRPTPSPLAELRSGHAEEQDRSARREQRDVLDQVAGGLLAPLDVVEDDHERSDRRCLLQRLAKGPGELLGRRRSTALAEERADRSRGGLVGGNHVELLENLDDGPVGDALAVGQTAASHDRRLDRRERLGDEAGLPDAGVADDRHQLTPGLDLHPAPRRLDESQLARTADERGVVSSLRLAVHVEQPVGGDRLGLTLEPERLHRLDVHSRSHERQRRVADQHLSGLRGLLESRGDVDRVTGHESLLGAGDDLAGHDADPACEAELGQRVAHLGGGPHRPQGIVLVQRRRAEHRHHGVPDELLDGAAVRLDDALHPLEVAGEHDPQPLGVDRLPERGRARQVAEHHRHRSARLVRPGNGQLLRAAGGAEPEAGCPFVAARGTSRHQPSLRPARPVASRALV